MVTFVDLAPGTAVFFIDNGWNGSAIGSGGAFNTAESYFRWNSGASTLAAGTVIRFSSTDSVSLLAPEAAAMRVLSSAG